MKISELIESLEKIKEAHGDLDVVNNKIRGVKPDMFFVKKQHSWKMEEEIWSEYTDPERDKGRKVVVIWQQGRYHD